MTSRNAFKVLDISYHRNGMSGDGFHVVAFKNGGEKMIATVFEENGKCAILSVDLLNRDIIKSGVNSWRCEYFEDDLRKAIEEWEEKRSTSTL